MSEGFDKEAEREKLREKFEAEQSAREQTEQMSELLLKGATMTNKHCGECGDPIFRHNGQEFCPSCEQPVDPDEPESDAESAAPEPEVSGDAPPQPTDSSPADSPGESDSGPDSSQASETTVEAQQPEPPEPTEAPRQTRPQPQTDLGLDPSTGDLDDARTALVQTLTTYANRAAASDDPRRARDYLAAAREAAETVAAIDAIGR